ncbi:MAG: hypothetical protein B6D58_09095 [candidate division Zixibacteria bacterium 4484_95]|nr:MAG: hypothetical protein B6D58_09095 [candidate division Zixibacteria bacterium 4484_95]
MHKAPAGLTSSVKVDDKTFILQTEFLTAPKSKKDVEDKLSSGGKIVTSVAVDGQIVHKVEKVLHGFVESSELFSSIETTIKKQHISVARLIASRPREFINSVSEIKISPADRLGVIPGVADVIEIDKEFSQIRLQQHKLQRPVIENMEKIRNLLVAISQNTRLGRLKKIVGAIEDRKFLLTGCGGKFYLLNLKDDVDITKLLEDLEMAKL